MNKIDNFPEPYVWVLVYGGGGFHIALWDADNNLWRLDSGKHVSKGMFSHWKNLPPPPDQVVWILHNSDPDSTFYLKESGY